MVVHGGPWSILIQGAQVGTTTVTVMIKWERGYPVWEGDLPVWQQLADELKRRIRTGEYQPRKAIPTIVLLVDEFGVSRNTVRKVVEHLEREGYVRRHQGLGTFVAPKDQWPS